MINKKFKTYEDLYPSVKPGYIIKMTLWTDPTEGFMKRRQKGLCAICKKETYFQDFATHEYVCSDLHRDLVIQKSKKKN